MELETDWNAAIDYDVTETANFEIFVNTARLAFEIYKAQAYWGTDGRYVVFRNYHVVVTDHLNQAELAKNRVIAGMGEVLLFSFADLPQQLLRVRDNMEPLDVLVMLMLIVEQYLDDSVLAINKAIARRPTFLGADREYYRVIRAKLPGYTLEEKMSLYLLVYFDILIARNHTFNHAAFSAEQALDDQKIVASLELHLPYKQKVLLDYRILDGGWPALTENSLNCLTRVLIGIHRKVVFEEDEELIAYSHYQYRLDIPNVTKSEHHFQTLAHKLSYAALCYSGLLERIRNQVAKQRIALNCKDVQAAENYGARLRDWIHGSIERQAAATPGADFTADMAHLDDPLWVPQTRYFKELRELTAALSLLLHKQCTEAEVLNGTLAV